MQNEKESTFLQLIAAFEDKNIDTVKEIVPNKLNINTNLTEDLRKQVNLEFNRKFEEISILLLAILYDFPESIPYLIELNPASNRLVRISIELKRFQCLQSIISSQDIDSNVKDNNEQTILDLCLKSTPEILELILSIKNININMRSINGNTAVLSAAKCGAIQHFKILADHGADLTLLNDMDESVTHMALLSRNHTMLAEVLKYRVDTTVVNRRGLTPLMYAIRMRDEISAAMLIQIQSRDVNITDKLGITPLQQSVINGTHNITDILLRNQTIDINQQDSKGNTALHYACKRNCAVSVALLASRYDCDLNPKNINGSTPLDVAYEEHAYKAACALIVYDEVEVNDISIFPYFIYYFIKENNSEGIRSIIKRGVNFNKVTINNNTPLMTAVILRKVEAVRAILSINYIDVNAVKDGHLETALHIACTSRSFPLEIIRLLLLHPRIDVNMRDVNGNTPLYIAILRNYNCAAEYLIEHNDIELDCINECGNTPIMLAALKGNAEIGLKLIESGKCNLERLNSNNMTPLMLAVHRERLSMVKALVEEGNVDVFRQTEAGTAFSIALRSENESIIKYLIEVRAYDSTITENGETIYDIARQIKDRKLSDFVLDSL